MHELGHAVGISSNGTMNAFATDTGVVNPQVETLSIFGGEVRTDRQLVNKKGEYAGVSMYSASYAVCTENGPQTLKCEPLLEGRAVHKLHRQEG